ncbi:GerMN domain-containing protein [Verrucosispora sp. WMMD573]|uniref:GerMN domain-containing protein n=1 Tax=Verrucosispora sp. WMMD573 TaxID=3015149 RepID=UPI00248C9EC9|nr:GerMN domain-containing protein [Verrucosispora sp. WMMD573]WBB54667.1 GerMN domain-containing protein [Verrucosispora sp. WMMD573]
MTDGIPDGEATRDALRRMAGIAADTARPPDLGNLRHRVRRRRARSVAAAGLVAAVMVTAPVGAAMMSAPTGEPQVAAPAPTARTSPTPAPSATPPDSSDASSAATASAHATETGGPDQPATEPTIGTRQVKLFLLRERADRRCPQVVAVTRNVPARSVAKEALRALLDGPTPADRAAGLTSAFDGDAHRFRYLKLDGANARADFTDLDGILAPSDSCEKTKLLEPMRRTLEQFGWIEQARFSIRGDQRAFYIDVLHDRVPN